MELKKGENMIKHEDEIFSRPARTWFQSTKEKQNAEGEGHSYLFSCLIVVAAISKQQYELSSSKSNKADEKKASHPKSSCMQHT